MIWANQCWWSCQMAWRELLSSFECVGVGEQRESMWGWFLAQSSGASQPFCGPASSVHQCLGPRRVKLLCWPLATRALCAALGATVKKWFVTPCTLCRELFNPFHHPSLCFLLVWGVPWLPGGIGAAGSWHSPRLLLSARDRGDTAAGGGEASQRKHGTCQPCKAFS